ncbi:MAG: hypothetical protein ACRDU5_17535 [Mycobacterium sp.]
MLGGSALGRLRALAALTFVIVVALQTVGTVGAEASTNVVNVVAVNANGEPVNGFRVVNRQPSPNVSGCPRPSPAAVGDNIYACEPSEAAAEVCWPGPASVLCLIDPWSKTLRRFPSPGALPAVDPPVTPIPFALLLDDGTRCILPNGIDFGGGADGRVAVYGCGQRTWSFGVLVAPGEDPAQAIDRSQPLWKVIVGRLGPPTAQMGFVSEHTVTTAWFAASG